MSSSNINTFEKKVLELINILNTTGKNYRRVNHKLDKIIHNYIVNMKNKNNHLGNTYLDKMTSNIEIIFSKITEKQNYDALEFVNNVITWYFKCLAFHYNLSKIQPQIPDYTIAEINEICKSLL